MRCYRTRLHRLMQLNFILVDRYCRLCRSRVRTFECCLFYGWLLSIFAIYPAIIINHIYPLWMILILYKLVNTFNSCENNIVENKMICMIDPNDHLPYKTSWILHSAFHIDSYMHTHSLVHNKKAFDAFVLYWLLYLKSINWNSVFLSFCGPRSERTVIECVANEWIFALSAIMHKYFVIICTILVLGELFDVVVVRLLLLLLVMYDYIHVYVGRHACTARAAVLCQGMHSIWRDQQMLHICLRIQ